ncbi:MAG: AAA family ATPase, partial [Acidobacteriota bacterium]
MITDIAIENLRGIAEGRLRGLAPLTILTGPNASGKSTVLDALLIGAGPAPEDAVGRAVTRHPLSVGGGRWLFGDADQPVKITLEAEGQDFERWLYWNDRCDGDLEDLLFARRAQGPFSMVEVHGPVIQHKSPPRTGLSVDGQYVGKASSQAGYPAPASDFIRLIDPGIPIPLHRTYSEVIKSDRREDAKAVLKDFLPDFEELLILVDAGDSISG